MPPGLHRRALPECLRSGGRWPAVCPDSVMIAYFSCFPDRIPKRCPRGVPNFGVVFIGHFSQKEISSIIAPLACVDFHLLSGVAERGRPPIRSEILPAYCRPFASASSSATQLFQVKFRVLSPRTCLLHLSQGVALIADKNQPRRLMTESRTRLIWIAVSSPPGPFPVDF